MTDVKAHGKYVASYINLTITNLLATVYIRAVKRKMSFFNTAYFYLPETDFECVLWSPKDSPFWGLALAIVDFIVYLKLALDWLHKA